MSDTQKLACFWLKDHDCVNVDMLNAALFICHYSAHYLSTCLLPRSLSVLTVPVYSCGCGFGHALCIRYLDTDLEQSLKSKSRFTPLGSLECRRCGDRQRSVRIWRCRMATLYAWYVVPVSLAMSWIRLSTCMFVCDGRHCVVCRTLPFPYQPYSSTLLRHVWMMRSPITRLVCCIQHRDSDVENAHSVRGARQTY